MEVLLSTLYTTTEILKLLKLCYASDNVILLNTQMEVIKYNFKQLVLFSEIQLPLETTTTTTTPRYTATKPHKPPVKPTKGKTGKPRRKDNDNRKDEEKGPLNQFYPELKQLTPVASVPTTTTQEPSVIFQQRNNAAHLSVYIFIGCVFTSLVILDNSL